MAKNQTKQPQTRNHLPVPTPKPAKIGAGSQSTRQLGLKTGWAPGINVKPQSSKGPLANKRSASK
jgi:hypothetical protein